MAILYNDSCYILHWFIAGINKTAKIDGGIK